MNTHNKPKRRNAPKTKAKILVAAQQAFSAHGYSQAGIRDVAAIAGISSPMLLHYFGSKAGLFEAALIDTVHVETLFHQKRNRFGEHLASLFLHTSVDINPPSSLPLPPHTTSPPE